MPTEEQVHASIAIIAAAKERLQGRIQLDSVFPDYFASYPKACVGGWGRQMMLIDPAGQAMPCHAASVIPGLTFDNVREHDLGWLWRESPAFQRFRGDAWMPDTCRSCSRKEVDFGGCRCQALLLTGNAEAMDPVCRHSPDHQLLQVLRTQTPDPLPIWRS
jgi:pyrroloquinoline quinone biosynthesis protein E